MNLEANKDIIRQWVACINDRRPDDLVKYMATDVIDHNKIIFGEDDAPGAAFDGLRQQLAALDPWNIKIEDLIAEDNKVVARLWQDGYQSGGHPRTDGKPSGKPFSNELIFIFTLKDAKVSEIRCVSDRMTMLTQLGVLPDIG